MLLKIFQTRELPGLALVNIQMDNFLWEMTTNASKNRLHHSHIMWCQYGMGFLGLCRIVSDEFDDKAHTKDSHIS